MRCYFEVGVFTQAKISMISDYVHIHRVMGVSWSMVWGSGHGGQLVYRQVREQVVQGLGVGSDDSLSRELGPVVSCFMIQRGDHVVHVPGLGQGVKWSMVQGGQGVNGLKCRIMWSMVQRVRSKVDPLYFMLTVVSFAP